MKKLRLLSILLAMTLLSSITIGKIVSSENRIDIVQSDVNANAGVLDLWNRVKNFLSISEIFSPKYHKLKIVAEYACSTTVNIHISRNNISDLINEIETTLNETETQLIYMSIDCVSAYFKNVCPEDARGGYRLNSNGELERFQTYS